METLYADGLGKENAAVDICCAAGIYGQVQQQNTDSVTSREQMH